MPADQFNCPTCQTLLRLAEPLPSGAKVKCPKCGTVFAAEEPLPGSQPAHAATSHVTSQPPRQVPSPSRRPALPDNEERETSGEELDHADHAPTALSCLHVRPYA